MDSEPHRFSAGLVDTGRWLEGMGSPQKREGHRESLALTQLQVLLFRISKGHNKSYRIFARVYK